MLSVMQKHFVHYCSTPLSPFLLILQALFPLLLLTPLLLPIKQFYIRSMQRNNGSAACASCRHQRKKCTEKCVLAPFFPVAKSQEFHAVHKVFGVSNVTKIVSSLNEEDRRKAVDSLVWEAVCRQKDPVLGPYSEYKRVFDELILYKRHCQQQYSQQNNNHNHYKTGPGLIGWSGNKGININPNNGGIGDLCPYSSMQKRQDMDNRSIILPQQLPINGFNQPYYIPVERYGYCLSNMDRHGGERICGMEESESALLEADITQNKNHEGQYTPVDP